MKKRSVKKLFLAKETLGRLEQAETLRDVLGGNSAGTYCCSETLQPSCKPELSCGAAC